MTPWKLLRTVFLVAVFAGVPLMRMASVASAQDQGPVTLSGSQSIAIEKQQLLREEFRERQREIRESAEQAKEARKTRHAHGRKAEPATIGEDRATGAAALARVAQLFGNQSTMVAPTNTKANDKTADAAGAGQAEQSVAFIGQNGLCAWNDGQGFNLTPQDVQGYGWTVDGGATWTDGGIPPKAGTIVTWSSDPVVTVNQKTGEFYYCGLTTNSGSTNGVGVARGHFQSGTFVWDGESMVASGPNASNAFDKQWIAADSLTGNIYVSWTLFVVGGDNIWTARSTDGGVTWSAPVQVSSIWENGWVSGSRPVVGPNGEVYITWAGIGHVDASDTMKVAKSTNNGASYGTPVMATNYYDNYFNGAPGFNRPRAVTFPSLACDRSTGPNRGKLYMTFHDCVDFYDFDQFFINSGIAEVENNGGFANATPFTIGQTVRGSCASTSDTDDFKFPAVAGTTYIFWADSVRSTSFRYQMRIYCPNDTVLVSRLASSGAQATNSATNSHSLIAWTCPTSGTYYLRMLPVTTGTGTNGYRILSTTHTPIAQDVARDARDVVVTASGDGGVTWTPRKIVNDEAALYDDWLPEVVVPCEGNPYIMWFDWRDAAASCYGGSNIYVTRSTDGGTTWAASQAATTALTPNWTQVLSNIAPNQGDYNGMYGGDCVALAMADGRLGDADVFTARIQTEASVTDCPSGQVVVAGTTFTGSATANNPNQMFSNTYTYSVTVNRNWPGMPAGGSVGVASQGTSPIPISIAVPDTAADGEVVHVCVSISINGACVESCCFDLGVINGVTATLASLVSSSAQPGRVNLAWQLTQSAMVNVYRATSAAGSWTAIGRQATGSDGMVKFEDTDVQAGVHYGYRLGIPGVSGEQFAGETWVDTPVNAEFAIRNVFPNPASAGFAVHFSLKSSAKASLELFDLSGRRVMSREVGSMGAGSHVFTLGDVRLPVGVYQLRLTQGGEVAKTSVSVIR